MRLVGLHRNPINNLAYLQVQLRPGHPFESVEMSEEQLLTLAIDAATMLRDLRENPTPPPTFVEED